MAFADGGGGSGKSVGSLIGNVANQVAQTVTKPKGKPKPKTTTTTKPSGGSKGGSSRGGSSRSGGGSSSGGYRSGGGGGNTNNRGGGGSAPKPSKPVIPTIGNYLKTDAEYQNFLSGSKRTLADYLSDIARRRGEAGTNFDTTLKSMETDRTTQLEDLRDEFASRGLINSGLFAEETGNFEKKFTEQRNTLQSQQAALLADLLQQETNFRREQDLAIKAAQQEALQRRVSKYQIGA